MNEEKVVHVEQDNGFQCNVNGISPIPITDEFLLNNGFDNKDNIVSKHFGENVFVLENHTEDRGLWLALIKHDNGWEIMSLREDNRAMHNSVSPIHYVHEMQNFLSLVKFGLNIKL